MASFGSWLQGLHFMVISPHVPQHSWQWGWGKVGGLSVFVCGWGEGRRIKPALTWLSSPNPFILRSQVHRMVLPIFTVVLPALANPLETVTNTSRGVFHQCEVIPNQSS